MECVSSVKQRGTRKSATIRAAAFPSRTPAIAAAAGEAPIVATHMTPSTNIHT